MSDPLNIITNPPCTVVKVQGTARDDVNGQLGIAIQYSQDRARYVVHMVSTQTTMALKPDNIAKASTFESYQAQFQQITKDPRMRHEITRYYNLVQSKVGFKPEYVAATLMILFLGIVYVLGFSRTLMMISIILIIALIIGPDLINYSSPRTVAENFPRRCRETIEQSAPFARGRLSNKVAAGIVLVMLAFGVRSLFVSQQPSQPSAAQAKFDAAQAKSPQLSLEEAYKQGFDDASNGKQFGESLSAIDSERDSSTSRIVSEDYSYYEMATTQPNSKPSLGLSQAMSAFFILKTAMELGNDQANGFSIQRAMANARVMDTWKLGILAFSCYNIVKAFI